MTVVSINKTNKPMEDFVKSSNLSQILKLDFRCMSDRDKMTPHQREAIDQILSLISRAGTTEANNIEVWRDIARNANFITADLGE
jgi:hypothetical protein